MSRSYGWINSFIPQPYHNVKLSYIPQPRALEFQHCGLEGMHSIGVAFFLLDASFSVVGCSNSPKKEVENLQQRMDQKGVEKDSGRLYTFLKRMIEIGRVFNARFSNGPNELYLETKFTSRWTSFEKRFPIDNMNSELHSRFKEIRIEANLLEHAESSS